MREDVIEVRWYIGRYRGEFARNCRGLSDSGIAYYVRNESGKTVANYQIEVAFRQHFDGPIPEHVLPATPQQVIKLEQLYRQRHPVHEGQKRITSTKAVSLGEMYREYLAKKRKALQLTTKPKPVLNGASH